MTELSTIRIPEKVYVGFQGRRSQDEVPLGFMTPWSDDKAGQKRRDTVDSWAKGYYGGSEKTFNSVMLENKPMIGFKVGRSIRRHGGWNGSGASYIRVEDPRGFELEITIENLVMCMSENLLQDGEIITECVWGRDGNRNILLPTNSEPYRASLATVEKLNNKVSLRDVKPGDEIELMDGTTGIYYGPMYGIQKERYNFNGCKAMRVSNKRFVLYIKDDSYNGKGKMILAGFASIKVDKIVKQAETKWTAEEIELKVQELLKKNDQVCKDQSNNGYGYSTFFWSVSDKVEITMSREVLTEAEIKKKSSKFKYDYYRDQWHLFGESQVGTILDLNSHFEENFLKSRTAANRSYRDTSSGHWGWNQKEIKTTGFIGYLTEVQDGPKRISEHVTHIEESDMKELFVIKYEYKTKAGTTLSIVL
jgi:hypothetical protein